MRERSLGLWALGLVLMLPHHAYASLMPAHLIDGFANVVSWIILIVLPIAFIALFWFVHIWPDTVAKRRQHPQRDAIHALCVLSLFFGGLLWPFAYLWAYTRPTMYKLAYGTDRYSPVEEKTDDTKDGTKVGQ
jgi:CBS domain containing-hemolysin-like protein